MQHQDNIRTGTITGFLLSNQFKNISNGQKKTLREGEKENNGDVDNHSREQEISIENNNFRQTKQERIILN